MSLTADPACNPCHIDTTPCSTPNFQNNVPYSTTPCNPNINATYQPEQYLNPMAGKTMPMRRVFQNQFPWVADLFFKYEDIPDNNGNIIPRLVFKTLNNMSNIQFYDGNYVTWGERYYKPLDFYITQDYGVNTKVVIVWQPDPNIPGNYIPGLGNDYQSGGRGMLSVNDTIMIYRNDPTDPDPDCCQQEIVKTITAIDPATGTITFEDGFVGDTGFTFRQGDVVKKLWHGRNDCDPITNTFGLQPSTAKRSYVQHFGHKWVVKKCDLNKAYATPQGAIDFLHNRIFNANIELVRSMIFTMYLGRNRGEICNSGATVPAETQGIISGMYQAQALNPSLQLITSLQNASTDEDKVRHILDELLKTQSSGLIPMGATVTMICNQKALGSLLKMNNAWNKFTGLTIQKTDNVTKDFTLPVIQTPNGRTELKYCQILTELYPNEGVIIFLPKDLITLTSRPHMMADVAIGGAVNGSFPMAKAQTLGLRIEDATMPGQHECKTYDIFTEAAIMIMGLDSGAIRMITGLRC